MSSSKADHPRDSAQLTPANPAAPARDYQGGHPADANGPADDARDRAGPVDATGDPLVGRWVPTPHHPDARKFGWIAAGALLVVYLLLLNPYWVPGGDSDFYVAAARTMARDGRYEYNGLPVNISPPGWPLLMAGVMKVWPTFIALKLVTLATMLGSLVAGYRVCLRFVSPKMAAAIILLTGTLLPVYTLTFFLHSEGLYCLLSAVALLHAFRISERRAMTWEWASLLVLSVAIPLVRWAGIFQWMIIAGALLSRWPAVRRGGSVEGGFGPEVGAIDQAGHVAQHRRRADAAPGGQAGQIARRPHPGGRALVGGPWTNYALRVSLVVACLALTLGTTLYTRELLKPTAADKLRAVETGVITPEGGDDEAPQEMATVSLDTTTTAAPEEGGKSRSRWEQYVGRIEGGGKWFSWLLWYPSRFGSVNKLTDNAVTLLGWFVIALVALAMIVWAWRRQLVWLALAGYTGALILGWPNPNARYFVPVAPLIVLGVLLGVRELGLIASMIGRRWGARGAKPRSNDLTSSRADRWRTALARFLRNGPLHARRLAMLFVITLGLCNAATLAVDVPVMRSGDAFYATFEAGQHQGLINICHYLTTQRTIDDGDLVVAERYQNLNRIRHIGTGPREVALLSDKVIRVLPRKYSTGEMPSSPIRRWMKRETKSDFFIMQEASVPWRVWHFRLPMWLHERLARKPVPFTGWHESGGWLLYEKKGDLIKRTPPEVKGWPTRVPGM